MHDIYPMITAKFSYWVAKLPDAEYISPKCRSLEQILGRLTEILAGGVFF